MSYEWGEAKIAGQIHKNQGNDLFALGKYDEALQEYKLGLKEVYVTDSASVCPERKKMTVSLHLNIAASLLKLKKPVLAEPACTSALKLDSRNMKAFLRRAKARIALGNVEGAQADLAEADRIDPHDKDTKDLVSKAASVEANESKIAEAIGCLEEGDFQDAIKCLKEAVESAEGAGAAEQAAHCCSYLGIACMQVQEWETAIEYHLRHVSYSDEINDQAERSRALGNLGSCYEMLGQHDRAIECHERQIASADDKTSKVDLCAMHGNLAIAHRSLGNFEKAIENHGRCLQLATDLQDEGLRAITYSNLGLTYRKTGNLSEV
jgi:tetratricopeptide (TPR) repeat protein